MKALHRHASRAAAFTLLEVVIVLAITALVLGAVYSLAQGTLTLADDVRRAERRDARTQAFTTFCEQLLMNLPANAMLNLTAEDHGQRLELEHVRSPFDETPDCRVALFTQGQPGGGLRLVLTCRSEANESSVVLFEELEQCEWRAFDITSRQWTTIWKNTSKPLLMDFSMTQVGIRESCTFWAPPNMPVQP